MCSLHRIRTMGECRRRRLGLGSVGQQPLQLPGPRTAPVAADTLCENSRGRVDGRRGEGLAGHSARGEPERRAWGRGAGGAGERPESRRGRRSWSQPERPRSWPHLRRADGRPTLLCLALPSSPAPHRVESTCLDDPSCACPHCLPRMCCLSVSIRTHLSYKETPGSCQPTSQELAEPWGECSSTLLRMAPKFGLLPRQG
ncbi:hypothetical protein LEMLEM_LOCUS4150 [Lemmus lemmus]